MTIHSTSSNDEEIEIMVILHEDIFIYLPHKNEFSLRQMHHLVEAEERIQRASK